MSPRISAVPAIDQSQVPAGFSGDGGTTSATGLPKRLTRIGLRVLRTCSSILEQLALNSEMAISFIEKSCHGPGPWSKHPLRTIRKRKIPS